MILKDLRLLNFMSFHGEQTFELDEGLNFVTRTCGSGNISLARAFQFAVLGSARDEESLNYPCAP